MPGSSGCGWQRGLWVYWQCHRQPPLTQGGLLCPQGRDSWRHWRNACPLCMRWSWEVNLVIPLMQPGLCLLIIEKSSLHNRFTYYYCLLVLSNFFRVKLHKFLKSIQENDTNLHLPAFFSMNSFRGPWDGLKISSHWLHWLKSSSRGQDSKHAMAWSLEISPRRPTVSQLPSALFKTVCEKPCKNPFLRSCSLSLLLLKTRTFAYLIWVFLANKAAS